MAQTVVWLGWISEINSESVTCSALISEIKSESLQSTGSQRSTVLLQSTGSQRSTVLLEAGSQRSTAVVWISEINRLSCRLRVWLTGSQRSTVSLEVQSTGSQRSTVLRCAGSQRSTAVNRLKVWLTGSQRSTVSLGRKIAARGCKRGESPAVLSPVSPKHTTQCTEQHAAATM